MLDWFIEKVLLWLWGTLWGKITLGVIVLLVAIVLWFRHWVLSGIFGTLQKLHLRWPGFHWRGIECRVRTVMENYFHGWNDGDLSALQADVSPEVYQELAGQFSEAKAGSLYRPFKVKEFYPPKPVQVHTPTDERPAVVVVRARVDFPHLLSSFGKGMAAYVLDLVYEEDGRWVVHKFRREDDYWLLSEWELNVDPDWLTANGLPEPHEETAFPHRPAQIRKPILGTGGVLRGHWLKAVGFFLFAVALVVALILGVFTPTWRDEVREEGQKASAAVTEIAWNPENETYRVKYRFTVPGSDKTYVQKSGEDRPVVVKKEVGKPAMDSRQIPVIYLPADPSLNLPDEPEPSPVPAIMGISLLFLLAVSIMIWAMVQIAQISKKTYSPFWKGWKENGGS